MPSRRYVATRGLPFAVDNRKIVKIGANVSKETRNIEKWIIKE